MCIYIMVANRGTLLASCPFEVGGGHPRAVQEKELEFRADEQRIACRHSPFR